MADVIIPTLTLAPRSPRGPDIVTVTTTNAGVTVFITDEVKVYITETVEVTTSIFDTSFITATTTITDTSISTSTITRNLTTSETLTLTPTPARYTISALPTHAPVKGKHVDPFQVLSIIFGVLILSLLTLMWFLVRRFYKMYRAERVMRKQIQTEGTELVATRMGVSEGERHMVGSQ